MTEAQLVTFLGTAALKAFIILAIAGLVNTAWRSASASARHLVWTIGIASALTLPLLSAGIQRLGAPRIEIATWNQKVEEPDAAPASLNAVEVGPGAGRVAVFSAETSIDAIEGTHNSPAQSVAAPSKSMIADPSQGFDSSPLISSPSTASRVTLRERYNVIAATLMADWKTNAFYLWLAGVVLSLLPLATAIARVRMLEARARVLGRSRWTTLIEKTPAISHLSGRVRVLESDRTTMPMTWGIVTPTLLVPAASERWPEWQCRNILLHELAHVERRDCLTQLAAQLACAVYWFNPLVWVAAHQMRVERELACDDRVISAGSRASDYAANLLDVARSLRAPSYTSQSAIAMARPSQLSGRLLAVLDTNRNRRSVTRRVAAAVSLAALVVALPLASMTPR